MWDKRAQVVEVHDGDTITVILDQGFDETKKIKLRLFGVFAPELKDEGGQACREFLTTWLATHDDLRGSWPFVVTTARTPISDTEQQTLGRYVGTLTSRDGTSNLNVDIANFIQVQGYGHGTGWKS